MLSPQLETEAALCERFEQALLASPPESLLRRGQWLDTECLVQIGDTPFHIQIAKGRVVHCSRHIPLVCSTAFVLKGSVQAWSELWQPVPRPGWHDLFALIKQGEMSLQGNTQVVMAHLQFLKDLFDLPAHRAPVKPEQVTVQPEGEIEPIVGRYVHVDIEGEPCRVYFEEAGQGIPLLCLHTAGADSRQFRHLMCDESVTRHFRVIAFDMPWHGKSYPPIGFEDQEPDLTTQRYVAIVRSVARALKLDKPVAMGCSIGGRIVLQLAHAHGAEFRALIGLESSDHQTPWYDTRWLNRPDVHGGEVCAALVSGLVAATSPARYRHETLWQYKQGGPGVFKGDLYFYRVDSDLRGQLGGIDTARTPLYLLTGEYDFSCTPHDTLRTAETIPGSQVTIMKDLGHFPMSENPRQFREYLLPVLDAIRNQPGH